MLNITVFFKKIVYFKQSDKRNKEIAEKLVEKHVRDHVYRRLSAGGGGGHSESEKVI